jgi:hypothetical protein
MRSRYLVVLTAVVLALCSTGAACGSAASKLGRGGASGASHTGSSPTKSLKPIKQGHGKACRSTKAHENSKKAQGRFDDAEDGTPIC